MAALPDLITVAQYRQITEDGNAYELHHGEVVRVKRPKARHYKLQLVLERLLAKKLMSFGEVAIEMPYRPVAEFELCAADVAALSHKRWDEIDPNDNLRGAPELVIEVKSPSNTDTQLRELASLCLANGCLQLWIVDADRKLVTVIQRDGSTEAFGENDEIPLGAFGGDHVRLADIFA